MIQDFDYLLRWLTAQKINDFRVFPKAAGKLDRGNGSVFMTDTEEPNEKKIEDFKDWFYNDLGGIYVLQQIGGNSNNAQIDFKIPYRSEQTQRENAAQTTQFVPSVAAIPDGYLSEKEFETRVENERLKMQIEKLESEIKELKKNAENSGGGASEFFKAVTPFVAPVLQGILNKGKVTPVAQIGKLEDGADNVDGFEISDEEFAQLSEDLKVWSSSDPDYLKIIHALSHYTNDPMYNTAKSFLLK